MLVRMKKKKNELNARFRKVKKHIVTKRKWL